MVTSEIILSPILSLLPIGVEVYDKTGDLIFQNEADKKIFGGEDLTHRINLFSNPNLSTECKAKLLSGENINIEIDYDFSKVAELKYFNSDIKGIKYLSGVSSTVTDDDGNILYYIFIIQDIHSRLLLENQFKKIYKLNKIILDNTHSGFIYFTSDYKVQWENLSKIYPDNSYKKGCICYKKVKQKDAPCKDCILEEAMRTKEILRREICVDGMFLDIIATPVFNNRNDLEGVVMRIDDITERKNINLELKEAKEKAEQSNLLKSAFLANMSHEIRTPLNAIVGFSQVAMNTDSEEERDEYRKIISANSDLLLNLINDILDLSKIESGYIDIHPDKIDLTSMVNELQVSFSLRKKPNVEIVCETPHINCITEDLDKQRVLQVYTNFVANAVKFTTKGRVTIGYECVDGGVRIFVSDTGIGISEENKKKVFHRFQKFDTFTQGTGLGLSICKAIIETMHGKIGFESQEGKGSTFWAWLPCNVFLSE